MLCCHVQIADAYFVPPAGGSGLSLHNLWLSQSIKTDAICRHVIPEVPIDGPSKTLGPLGLHLDRAEGSHYGEKILAFYVVRTLLSNKCNIDPHVMMTFTGDDR